MAGALQNAGDAGPEVNHGAALLEKRAVFRIQDGAPASRQYDIVPSGKLANDFRLSLTKAIFAIDFKNEGDGCARACFDFVILIDEALIEFLGKGAADGGLARPHQAHQKNVMRYGHKIMPDPHAADLVMLSSHYLTTTLSFMTLGDSKINKTNKTLVRAVFLKRFPTTGISPKSGTLVTVSRSCWI